MNMTAIFVELQAANIVECLQEARMKLDGAGGETILDFSAIQRIDPQALRAMEELLDLADDKTIKITLQGVNVDIYKVLKLVKRAPKLSFLPRENGRSR